MDLPGGQLDADETLGKNAPEMMGFLDVEFRLEIQVGGAVLTVGEIINLKAGDVVKLDRSATQEVLLTVETIPVASVEVTCGEKGTSIQVVEIESGAKSGARRSAGVDESSRRPVGLSSARGGRAHPRRCIRSSPPRQLAL